MDRTKRTKESEKQQGSRQLTLAQKAEIFRYVDSGHLSDKQIASLYGVHKSTITKLIKNRPRIERTIEMCPQDYRKNVLRDSRYAPINDLVWQFFTVLRNKNIPVSGPLLQRIAKRYADALGLPDFGASDGWLSGLRKRHNISSGMLSGESGSADLTKAAEWKIKVPEVIKDYDYANIFNMDETACWWRQLPNRSLFVASDERKGIKQSKERLTVALTCSALGEKLQPIVIGTAMKPRAFAKNNVTSSTLPVFYRANKSAWMTSGIFTEWANRVNDDMKDQDRTILILLDNASSHPELQLSHVKFVFFPPNLTSIVQPLDQGIIRSFKAFYRNQLLDFIIDNVDKCNSAHEFAKLVDVYEAVKWISQAWERVTSKTIRNCFVKAGVVDPRLGGPIIEEPVATVMDKADRLPDFLREELTEDYVTIDDGEVCTEDFVDIDAIADQLLPNRPEDTAEESNLFGELNESDQQPMILDIQSTPLDIRTHAEALSAIAGLHQFYLGNGSFTTLSKLLEVEADTKQSMMCEMQYDMQFDLQTFLPNC